MDIYRPEDEDARRVVLSWYRRARSAQLGHACAVGRLQKANYCLGVPGVVASAIVGSSIIASVNASLGKVGAIFLGLLSILATVTSALHLFLHLEDRIREHKAASRAFGGVRRELGTLGALGHWTRAEIEARLDKIREAYDRAAEATPNVPDRIRLRCVAESSDYWPSEFAGWPESQQLRK